MKTFFKSVPHRITHPRRNSWHYLVAIDSVVFGKAQVTWPLYWLLVVPVSHLLLAFAAVIFLLEGRGFDQSTNKQIYKGLPLWKVIYACLCVMVTYSWFLTRAHTQNDLLIALLVSGSFCGTNFLLYDRPRSFLWKKLSHLFPRITPNGATISNVNP